jgi:hypothetical protein
VGSRKDVDGEMPPHSVDAVSHPVVVADVRHPGIFDHWQIRRVSAGAGECAGPYAAEVSRQPVTKAEQQHPAGGFNSCVFVVHGVRPAERDLIAGRVEALERYFEPLGTTLVTGRYDEHLSLYSGAVTFGEGRFGSAGVALWGGPLPSGLRTPSELLDADDEILRGLDVVVAMVAVGDSCARIVSGAAGPTALYTSRFGGMQAWATHAVAATWLAAGAASVDAWAIPCLLGRDFVGGSRTLFEGTSAVAPATCVEIQPSGVRTRSYWPLMERWRPAPEPAAFEEAQDAFLDGLKRHLNHGRPIHLGLTGGMDSRVVALGLRECGLEFDTFTWGEAHWPDTLEAVRVAGMLGVRHESQPINYRSDEMTLELIDAEIRWTEGVAPVRFVEQRWPEDASTLIGGMGGETGRAFYYDSRVAAAVPEPSPKQLRQFFDARGKLFGASQEAIQALREEEQEWLEATAETGLTGWRRLDVLYAEQRVRRWGRSTLPCSSVDFIAAFATPPLGRSLVSMSLEDRLGDGFHRGFLSRAPGLSLPPADKPAPRSRLRQAAAGLPGARAAAALLRRPRPLPSGGAWPAHGSWLRQPRMHAWLTQEVLESPLLVETMGQRWLDATRAGFLRNESVATEAVLLAAGPVALAAALRSLN